MPAILHLERVGSTPSVGLGLALARPDRRVAVITGDGDVLMALGSLATIGVKQPGNLSIVCLDNGHYSATGMQPSAPARGSIWRWRLRPAACAWSWFPTVRAGELRKLLHSGEGPFFIHARSMPTIRSASFRAATARRSSIASCRQWAGGVEARPRAQRN